MDSAEENATTEGALDFDHESEEEVRIEARTSDRAVRLRETGLGPGELPKQKVPAMPLPKGANGHSPQARPSRNPATRHEVLVLRLREVPSMDPREH